MDPNSNNMGGMPNNGAPAMPPKPTSSAGTMTALVLILAVLIIGGFYFWGERAGTESMDATYEVGSDTTTDIEADLNSTDVDNVDYDLNPENFNAS